MARIDLIKKFDERFKTKFHKRDDINTFLTSKKSELGLKNLKNPDNLLTILAYSYLEESGFRINNEYFIINLNKKTIKELKKVFRNPLICEPKNKRFILILTKNISKDIAAENLYKLSKFYRGSDIIYFDKKDKILVHTKGKATTKIKKLIKENKISLVQKPPKKINTDPFEKILKSKKLDIFEVEFRNLNFPSLKGLYLKTGSKQDRINSKIKEIMKIFIYKSILRASNIKSIHFGLKGCEREESSSLIITFPSKALGIYQIKWRGTPNPELATYVRREILKDLLYIDLIDKNTPYIEHIVNYLLNKFIQKEVYEKQIKQELTKWDKYKLLNYDSKIIKPQFQKVKEILESLFFREYEIEETNIEIDRKTNKNGILMKNKKTGKEIFVFLNKWNTSKKIIDKMVKKEKPIIIFDFSDNIIDQMKRFNFLRINEEGVGSLIKRISDICNRGVFYRNQKERFLRIGEPLKNVYAELKKIKTSQGKGSFWEKTCEDLLDYIFNRTFPLSGPNFPDGRSYFNSENEGFIWDSKALLNTELSKSILDKSKRPKDLAYINVFRKKIKMDYYTYLSCGVKRDEFFKVKKILSKYQKKVKFVCITENALKDLWDIFSNDDRASMIHKNMPIFIRNLKILLNKEYVDSIKINDLTKNMIKKDELDIPSLRRKIKEERVKLKPVKKSIP